MAHSVIFIGLGGTGIQIVNDLKKEFEPHNDVAFLCVDIGDNDFNRVAANLNNTEKCDLTGGNVKTIIENPLQFNLLKDWWPTYNFRPNLNIDAGALARRIIAKLALFCNGNKEGAFVEKLRSAIASVENNRIDFIVISSTCGGCGSGLFPYMPGIIDKEMNNNYENYNVFGILLNYDVLNKQRAGGDQSVMNTISLFKELDASTVNVNVTSNIKFTNEDYTINLKPYQDTFLITAQNKAQREMDSFGDYIGLSVHLSRCLFDISNTGTGGRSFSGIENILADVTLSPIAKYFTNYNGNKVHLPISVGNNYGSFGYFKMYLPKNDIRQFLKSCYYDSLNLKLSNSTLGEDAISEKANKFIENIKESGNTDKLVNKAYSTYRDNASGVLKERDEHKKIKTISDNLSNVSKKVFKDHVMEYKSLINKISDSMSGSFSKELDRIYKDKEKELVDGIIHNSKYSFADQSNILDKIKTLIIEEKNDFDADEKKFSETTNLENDVRQINSKITDIEDLKKRFFEKTVDFKHRKKQKIDSLAEYLINTYEKRRILADIVESVDRLYSRLIEKIEFHLLRLENIQVALKKVKSKTTSAFEGLSGIDPVVRATSSVDILIRIANDKDIIKHKLLDRVNESISINPTDLNLDSRDIESDIDNLIIDSIDAILNDISLQEALDWEADHMIFHQKFKAEVSGSERIFTGLKDLAERGNDDHHKFVANKWDIFYTYNSIRNSLKVIKAFKGAKIETITTRLKSMLTRGRLAKVIESWNAPFYNLSDSAAIPLSNVNGLGTKQDNRYFINSERNSLIKDKVNNLIIHKEGLNDCESISSLELVRLSFATPIEQIRELTEQLYLHESRMNEEILRLINTRNITDLQFYFTDRKFFSEPSFAFTRIPLPVIQNNELLRIWNIVLLLLANDYVSKDWKLIKDIKYEAGVLLKKELTTVEGISRDCEFGSMATVFKFLIFIYEKNEKIYTDLLAEIKSKIKSVSDIEKNLNEYLDFMKKEDPDAIDSIENVLVDKIMKDLK